jgi:hypothetical protein
VTLRLYEIPDGARVTTVIAPGGKEFVTTRAGNVIRVVAAATGDTSGDNGGDWQAWHAGRIIRAQAGVAEFTVLHARPPPPAPRESAVIAALEGQAASVLETRTHHSERMRLARSA